MSDIFISYASEDKSRVEALAHALERKGWSVWWDRRIPIGRSFDEVIEEALDGSKAVVVVWTSTSVKSQWVKNEAREGLRRRVLFPVMLLEEVRIPLEFRDVQTAHLMDWRPEQEHHGFTQFIDDLTQVIGVPSSAGIPSVPVTQKEEPVPTPPSPTPEPEPETEPLPDRGSELIPESEHGREEPEQRVVPPDDSFPYLPIALGALVAIGALVYWLFVSQGSSPVTRDVPPYQPPVPAPSSQPEVPTPSPTPDSSKQTAAAPAPTKPTVKPTVKPKASDAQTTADQPPPPAGPAKTITGKDGAPMVLVPEGKFWMGSPDGEGDESEHPHHPVMLEAFYMDKFEVTVSKYAEFLRAKSRSEPMYWDQVDSGKHRNLPVVGVDWQDADAYCQWAGKRLPTEAEWEKAARGTDRRMYPWGNEQPTARLANFGKEYTINVYDERLAPSDSYEMGKSPYGFHHMAGNVWEWVADWYDEHYYSKSPARNPTGPSSGEYRVLRGGSWLNEPVNVRSADRYRLTPSLRLVYIGFRCAQDIK